MLLAGALGDMIPGGFKLGGGIGIAGVLAVLLPVFDNICQSLFNFSFSEYFGRFFNKESFLGQSFGLVGLGAGAAGLQQLWQRAWHLYQEYFTVSIDISKADPSFRDIVDWIKNQQWKDRRHLDKTENKLTGSGKWESVPELFPTLPMSSFCFDGRSFDFEMISKGSDNADDWGVEQERTSNSYLRIKTTGSQADVFERLTAQFRKFKVEKQEEQIGVYIGEEGGWSHAGTRRKRPLDSVILAEGVAEMLVDDMQDFLDSAQWYCGFGVPYRRGYMLYGPPGTGKTSLVSALAGYFDRDVCILNLADKNLDDERLMQLFRQVPNRAIVLLEDIDAALPIKDESGDLNPVVGAEAFPGLSMRKTCNALTFSGLLNALDGVASCEGRILFMTTNHIENLDPALIRPGRVDITQCIDYASEDQIRRMFERFHPEAADEEVVEFAQAVMEAIGEKRELSLARLQGLFLTYKSRPHKIFEGIAGLAGTSFSKMGSVLHTGRMQQSRQYGSDDW